MVSEGMVSLDGEEQRVRCWRQHGASSMDPCGNLPPFPCAVKSHEVLVNSQTWDRPLNNFGWWYYLLRDLGAGYSV